VSEERKHIYVPMIAATAVLKPPPARIGRISKDITLPRTVEIRQLVAALIGMFIGLFLWVFPIGLLFSYSLMSLVYTAIAFAAAAVFLTTWSPIKGESFATWLGLSAVSTRGDKVVINGEKVKAYICTAPLHFSAAGFTHIKTSCVPVPYDSVDERGVFKTSREHFEDLTVNYPVLYNPPSAVEGFEPLKGLDVATLKGTKSSRPRLKSRNT